MKLGMRSAWIMAMFSAAHLLAAAALAQPPSNGFSHRRHLGTFSKLGVTCTNCHSFEVKSKGFDPLSPDVKGHLLKPNPETCQQCHGEHPSPNFTSSCVTCHADKKNSDSHVVLENCSPCHVPRHFTHASYAADPEKAKCLSCHTGIAIHHPKVGDFIQTDRAKGLTFSEGQISCLTCHSPHHAAPTTRLLRPQTQVTTFCASCHGAGKSKLLFKQFHERMNER